MQMQKPYFVYEITKDEFVLTNPLGEHWVNISITYSVDGHINCSSVSHP